MNDEYSIHSARISRARDEAAAIYACCFERLRATCTWLQPEREAHGGQTANGNL
jgi:hypothetical protein